MHLWEINRAEQNFMILKYYNINVVVKHFRQSKRSSLLLFLTIMHAGRSDFMTFAIQRELIFALGSR